MEISEQELQAATLRGEGVWCRGYAVRADYDIHRLATGDVMGAFSENFLAPPFALSVVVAVLLWRWPTLTRRRDELLFFAVAIIASIGVNVVHGPA